MSTQKTQHYVPKFLLKRFAATTGRWAGHIFRLDTRSGRNHHAVPRHEAAKNRYYDLPEEFVGAFQPETILGRIDSSAAAALGRMERRQELSPLDLLALAYFAALQASRTPQRRSSRQVRMMRGWERSMGGERSVDGGSKTTEQSDEADPAKSRDYRWPEARTGIARRTSCTV